MKDKDWMDEWVRRCGMVPVQKHIAWGYDIYIAEGWFYPFPERDTWPEPKHFPNGAYVVFWWIGRDEELLMGRPVFFDSNHDPDMFVTSRQQARVNSAIADAYDHMETLKKSMH